MKIKIILSLMGFFICSAFIGHKKQAKNVLLTDYRDAYVGNYFCQSMWYCLRGHEQPLKKYDTLTVNVTKDVTDSVMQISINNTVAKFKLKSGVLYNYPEEDRHKGGMFFVSDSIRLDFFTKASVYSLKGKKN